MNTPEIKEDAVEIREDSEGAFDLPSLSLRAPGTRAGWYSARLSADQRIQIFQTRWIHGIKN